MPQANPALTTIPSRLSPATIYLPEIHHRNGTYVPELTLADMSRDGVINDIASGQHEHVGRVIALNLGAGKCWDASVEIAREVLGQVMDCYGEVPRHCIDFLEDALGCEAVAVATRDMAA